MKKLRTMFLPLALLLSLITAACATLPSSEANLARWEEEAGSNPDGWAVIHYAAAYGSADEMNSVLSSEPYRGQLDSPDGRGNTPLMISALFDNADTFEALFDAGADTTAQNAVGGTVFTYLGYFDRSRYPRIFEFLSSRGCSIDRPTEHNLSLVHLAAAGGNTELMTEILKYGVDVGRRDSLSELTAADFATLSVFPYTDLVEASPEDLTRRDRIYSLLESAGAPERGPLPLRIDVVGDFMMILYGSIDGITPFEIPFEWINRPEYFRFWSEGEQEYASLDEERITALFRDFGFRVNLTRYTEDLPEVYRTLDEAEEKYIVWFNLGNHPYSMNYWFFMRSQTEEGNYRGYLDAAHPNSLFDPLYVRWSDVSEIVAVEYEPLESP